jgi:4-amino-4-deoxy-L-arabinose transferase-like glycosyltransferase
MSNHHRLATRDDALALCALGLLFTFLLVGSWQRWTQPLLDHGREMHLPARLLAGEQLYLDAQFLYGPFAPYANALLYRVFGVHLSVLKASGAICAALILLMVYRLARHLMSAWESAAATALALVVCALKSTANYIQPYAYASLYALVFALGALLCVVSFLRRQRAWPLACAGLLAGLAVISKPEIALAALLAAAAAMIVEGVARRKPLWREAVLFLSPAAIITIAAYGLILRRVPWRVLLDDNHVLFTNMPAQLVYFNRHISGLAAWPRSLWFSMAGLGVFALWIGICAGVGALFSMRAKADWRAALKSGAIVLLVGAAWREASIRLLDVPSDVTPFASAVFVLPAMIGVLAWRTWRATGKQAFEDRVLLVIGVFSLASILRAALNVTTTGPYTPFFLPASIVVYLYLLFRVAPALLGRSEAVRNRIRRVAVCLIASLAVGMAINSIKRFRRLNTFEVSSPRGSFLTTPEIGEPLAAAIRYVESRTKPDDYVLALPVATTINFLTGRRYPLREEIVHPGFLDGDKEDDAIERLRSRRVPLVLVANLDTSEFRDRAFGVDYNVKLMDWIRRNYRVAARFDPAARGDANFGREPFFIIAYERNE